MANQNSYHNCPYCSQLVLDGDPYCSKCGGPQVFKPKGGGVALNLDPWIITDNAARTQFEQDPVAVKALVNTWRNDPDHAKTRAMQNEIKTARERGDLERIAWYYCCPWSPVYQVKRDVNLNGQRFKEGQQFTFDVSAEAIPEGGKFKREIIIGDFKPTNDIDYCLPENQDH